MKKTKIDIKGFESLLRKYKFDDPVPRSMQERMIYAKKDIFIRVLKTIGKYTALAGLIQFFYFFLKKIGINIFTAKILMSIMTIASVSGAVYIGIKNHNISREIAKPYVIEAAPEKSSEIAKAPVSQKEAEKTNYRLGILPFESAGVDREKAERLTTALSKGLAGVKGSAYAKVFTGAVKGTRYSLFGSLENIDNVYVLTIKVVDLKTSSIVMLAKKSAGSVEELEKECGSLAGGIISKIE